MHKESVLVCLRLGPLLRPRSGMGAMPGRGLLPQWGQNYQSMPMLSRAIAGEAGIERVPG